MFGAGPYVGGAMLRVPPEGRVTAAGQRNLERFRATAAAKEFEDDARVWTVVEWSWVEGPPLRVQVLSERGEVVDFVMDGSGVWRLLREPVDPRLRSPSTPPDHGR
jgi:hypothetical protein